MVRVLGRALAEEEQILAAKKGEALAPLSRRERGRGEGSRTTGPHPNPLPKGEGT